jgi:hypothetical protein
MKNLGKLALITSLTSNSKDALINLIIVILIISSFNSINLKRAKSYIGKFINKDSDINVENNQVDNNDKSDIPIDKSTFSLPKDNITPSRNPISINVPANSPSKSNEDIIKNNIKMMCKKIDQEQTNLKKRVKFEGPYKNEVNSHEKNYKVKPDEYDFNININESTCAMPIFHMRTNSNIDFYYNFILHNFNPKKINDLIMCKDIHKFMSTSSLTSDDIPDELAPVYFIKKDLSGTEVYEYLKIFIYTDEDNNKIGFVQKGNDYLYVKNDIDLLVSNGLIGDLLMNKHYINYNLSVNDGVTEFLDKLLSLVLIPELLIGGDLKVDIENYYENARAFEYHYNTLNSSSSMFRTSI